MSTMSRLQTIGAAHDLRLHQRHPLAGADLVTRLRYLGAVGLVTAVDRAPTEHERLAFMALGESMEVEERQVYNQLSERAEVGNDDVVRLLFATVVEQGLAELYLLDVAWLQVSNGTPATDNAVDSILPLLHLTDRSLAQRLQQAAWIIRQHDGSQLASLYEGLPPCLHDTVRNICNGRNLSQDARPVPSTPLTVVTAPGSAIDAGDDIDPESFLACLDALQQHIQSAETNPELRAQLDDLLQELDGDITVLCKELEQDLEELLEMRPYFRQVGQN